MPWSPLHRASVPKNRRHRGPRPSPTRPLALIVAAGVAAAAAVPALAAAQAPERAAFLAPGGDESVPVYFRSLAVQAVARQLQAEGLELIPRGRLRRDLRRAELLDCDRTDCADEVAEVAGVDFIAGVAVWAVEGTATEPGSVAVSLVAPSGASFSGTAPVEAGDVEAAALRALAEAREKQALGPGPWLVVDGTPEGAIVVVDGTPVGVVPHRDAIAPGTHQVLVRLDGYESAERTLDVALEPNREYRWEVALPAAGGGMAAGTGAAALGAGEPPADDDPPEDGGGGRSTLDTAGPIVLGLGGLAAIGVGLYGALAPEECTQLAADGDTCLVRENVPDPTGIAIWSAAGGAAVVGALLWWFLADTGGGGGGDDDSPDGARGPQVDVTISPVDVGLRVTF